MGWRKEATYVKGASREGYPFPASDLWGVLDDLLENGIIELPAQSDLKRPEGLLTQSTVAIIGSLAILSRNA